VATTQTTNYGLVKPTAGTGELVSVQAHLDDNWDKIDQDMNRYDWQVFSVTGTWNKPARCKRVEVIVVGGGGSGGGTAATSTSQVAGSGGGGGGGCARKMFLASTLAASETVTVGTGGAAATAGNNTGNAGNNSSFATGKAYVVTANGGAGGSGGAVVSAGSIAGGAGGTASGGDLNMTGSDGGNSTVPTATVLLGTMFGGSSPMGGSARSDTSTSIGNAGKPYGGGSSGSGNFIASQAAKASAAGADGVVLVKNYY